jgi:GDPmannose 4,6-dehydratase
VKVLIFGSSGQDGNYLSAYLKSQAIQVVGISRSGGDVMGTVSDFVLVSKLVRDHQPDFIFHFAAISTTRHNVLFENHEAISTGTLNILDAVRIHSPRSKVFLSGSALQFKNTGLPIDENTAFEASSAYSLARIHSIYAGRYYRNAFGLKVYSGYFFNHDSPFRSVHHINQKIVSVVNRISKGSNEKLELGNIDVRKEFSYAVDIVDAVWKLVNQDNIFEAVIGSGKAYSIKEFTDYCFKKVSKNYKDFVVIKEGFTPEYDVLVSNPRLISSLGWEPKTDFFHLADLMMDSYDSSY